MDLKITKRREVRDGLQSCWRIYANGRRTTLFIEKAVERPAWGCGQEYDLCHDTAGFLMAGSVVGLMSRVSDIVGAFCAEAA